MTLLLAASAWAGGGYDHNHSDVEWRTLETEHFYFHWPEAGKDKDDLHWFTTQFTVSQLARIAEESYPAVTGQLGYELTEKTHVVIYDQDMGWEGNGFAIAEYDWTGFAAKWGPTFRMRGRMEFLEDVFVHEFAHIVSLKAYLPWSEDSVGADFGGLPEDEEWLRRWGYKGKTGVNIDPGVALPVVVHTPFYWAEGGAEYWSHKAGYNFWGTSREAFLRMSWYEDRVLDPDEWTTRVDKAGFDGERGYNHGYAYGLWLAGEFENRDLFSHMARISNERWHYDWNKVEEAATGVPAEVLHQRWRDHLDTKFQPTVDRVEKQGIVKGREIRFTEPPWEKEDPPESWLELSKNKRDAEMDGDTAYVELPSVSPDGKYFAWFEKGLNVYKMRPIDWGAVSGAYVDPEDKKTLKDWSRAGASSSEYHYYKVGWHPSEEGVFVGVGAEDMKFNDGLTNLGLTVNADGYNWTQLAIGTVYKKGKNHRLQTQLVPNTLRAVEAAWHPDGKTIAFGRYGDGTHEIWTIQRDGTGGKQLTQFGDGTQIQGIEYSKDGKLLLVSLFRNYQQDLWLMEPDTGTWYRLTDSRADETDPSFGADGKVWFTSDVDGIFNVYSLDIDTKKVTRHTNLVGGAYGSEVSPDGHLFYTGFTGHGYRVFGMNHDKLLQEVVDYPGLCGVDTDVCTDDQAYMAHKPPIPDVYSLSNSYKARNAQFPFSMWPVARTTDRNVEMGGYFFVGDVVEKHYLEGQATFGKDNYLYLSYWNATLWPQLNVGYMRYSYKGTYGYGDDLDGVASTTDDLTVVDVKFEQVSDDLWLYGSFSASDYLWLGAGIEGSRYSFRDTGDGPNWVPYQDHAAVGAYAEWTLTDPWYSGEDWINPRGGRRFWFDYSLRGSHIIDPEIAGAVYDDGELKSAYNYNQILISYSEFVPVPLTETHTLQFDLDLGYIDRNVLGWDEFFAGGRHPYFWGNGTIGNNVQFSGYEGNSLAGETMIIANASYRFPIWRDLNWKTGPVYTDAVWLQLIGSAGNLWSYRVEGETHLEGYAVVPNNPNNIRREVPFVDYSAKNSPAGQKNYILGDIGAELRVRSMIWNDYDWDSFLRVAYGLNETAGYGDVNADMIQSSVARDAASELSAETEPPTVRVYLGLGTGW